MEISADDTPLVVLADRASEKGGEISLLMSEEGEELPEALASAMAECESRVMLRVVTHAGCCSSLLRQRSKEGAKGTI